ncbi:gallidermin family lantibiotic [Pseudarthrobacter oxydans]|uniref:gallidermin family lantibiotic n=1 Tax=Pseudarthrobacter oxydans TaxID=1671 RepID=UPI003D2DE534
MEPQPRFSSRPPCTPGCARTNPIWSGRPSGWSTAGPRLLPGLEQRRWSRPNPEPLVPGRAVSES